MLDLLLDGQRHTAGELATAARVKSPAASEHLAVLVDSGLVQATASGRRRYFEIVDARTASALEAIGDLSPPAPPVTSLRLSREQRRLRMGRTCYDHLAGQLGVAVHDGLVGKVWLDPETLGVTCAGATGFVEMGIDLDELRRNRRPLTRSCVDWTERRPHLAGALGAAVATVFLDHGWVLRKAGSRGLTVTDSGRLTLESTFGTSADAWLESVAS
jgi:DNA-binding transcriptional ArsR family regulator